MYRIKGVLKNFANFTEKNLHWNLFLIKLQVWRPFFKDAFFEEHLRTTASVISKINVNHKYNGFTRKLLYYSSMLYRNFTTDISLKNLPDFVRIFWMAASKIYAKDKNMFSVGIKSHYYDLSGCYFDMFLANDLRNQNQYQNPEGFCKKGVFKSFAKIAEKHLCCFFLTKIQAYLFITKRFKHWCFL